MENNTQNQDRNYEEIVEEIIEIKKMNSYNDNKSLIIIKSISDNSKMYIIFFYFLEIPFIFTEHSRILM